MAHEADAGIDAKLQMRGLFDMYRWTVEKFECTAAVKSRDGKCGVEKDHAYIEGLFMQRGGYERLDNVIAEFRAKMQEQLMQLIEKKTREGADGGVLYITETWNYDWCLFSFFLGDG